MRNGISAGIEMRPLFKGGIDSAVSDQQNWLVVSTHLKNVSQNGNLPQIGVKIKNV